MPKILVADDNTNIQKMVTLAFEERGIQVIPVGNGEAAVRRIPDLNPDLILADIFMPVRNGYEVCEFVKKDERFSHIPVILLVGAFDPLDEKEARRVGADGVLKKPFVPPDPLIAMVTSALEKNPKLAAELARAKEAPPTPPPPMPELTPPAMAESKPLPEFPEPTAEEAAAIYGFGKGVRAIGDDIPAEAGSEPKAPIGEAEETSEDEFDGAATSNDWRRNAMDFEVPAGSANQPAFSSDQGLESGMFPSERDVPPRHIRIPDPVEEAAPVMQDEAPASVEAQASSSHSFFDTPTVEDASEPAPVANEAEPAIPEASAVEPERNMTSSGAHWMDSVASGKSDYPSGGWTTVLCEQQAEPKPVENAAAAPFLPATPVESQDDSGTSQAFAPEPESAQSDSFFADDAQGGESQVNEPAVAPPAPVWEMSRDAAPEPQAWQASHGPVASSPQSSESEFEKEPAEPTVSMRDPMLVEPPAVHVSPEPLLVDDDVHGPSSYGSSLQDVTPLHSFLAPASEDPVVEERAGEVEEASVQSEFPVPSFESSPDEFEERVPTGPPPNREALAEIPFLRPPVDFHAAAPEPVEANSETVDNVVRKVLEKLEPQLHDLLSQGVLKPLVENLLQSELAKKGK